NGHFRPPRLALSATPPNPSASSQDTDASGTSPAVTRMVALNVLVMLPAAKDANTFWYGTLNWLANVPRHAPPSLVTPARMKSATLCGPSGAGGGRLTKLSGLNGAVVQLWPTAGAAAQSAAVKMPGKMKLMLRSGSAAPRKDRNGCGANATPTG